MNTLSPGLESSPQEEFLSLLGGARISPALNQFLVNSLGEVGVKRVLKSVCGTGKELQLVVLDHLQPAAEIIGFRMGELRGLSRWRARYQGIGLDERLLDEATENAGLLLVQVQRFMMVLSSVVQQFSNFFNWLLKSIKYLMQEPNDQLMSYNSELLVVFLKFLYDQDPVKDLVDLSEADDDIEIDIKTIERVRQLIQFGGFSDTDFLRRTLAKEFQHMESSISKLICVKGCGRDKGLMHRLGIVCKTIERVRQLIQFGGFSDTDFLRRTLAKEFQHMESSFKRALQMPFTTISRKISCMKLLPLCPLQLSTTQTRSTIPMSISFYKNELCADTPCESGYTDYISFQVPDEAFPDIQNCIGIAKGFKQNSNNQTNDYTSLEAVLLSVPSGYHCVDLSLYKDKELVLLMNETSANSEGSGEACMMVVQTGNLPFISISRSTCLNQWELEDLKSSIVYLEVENEKVRKVPHSTIAPLAVSASRGVACVFAERRRALVYILEEDEDEEEVSEDNFKRALQMPFTTISRKISCMKLLPLCPLQLSTTQTRITIPMSLSFYKNELCGDTPCESGYTDYISFQVPDEAFPDIQNCIGIAKGFKQNSNKESNDYTSLEAVLLSVPSGYHCVDLSLYKDKELVLLMNETSGNPEGSGEACMMVVQTGDLPFISISRSSCLNQWELEDLKSSIVYLEMENEKVRKVPHSTIAPLAVSASRGVACVFAERRRALVYILEEDEDEEEVSEDK
ncbi:hypothetical protein F2Q70_00034755 [Brassica cretica]|uniref:Anaphase-promoting complex subunit 4 n=1 Tax=Brassica cretica TaxID=69181 RepID=A0A8S9JXS4_BRACR|nr:hypothetical protein F2Q70_00034755 [Brassica cretica]